jgi:hypothetical protein
MLPVRRSPAAEGGDRVERVWPFGMQLERGRLALVAKREAPSRAERPPQALPSRRTAGGAAPIVRQCTFAAVPVLQYFILVATRDRPERGTPSW